MSLTGQPYRGIILVPPKPPNFGQNWTLSQGLRFWLGVIMVALLVLTEWVHLQMRPLGQSPRFRIVKVTILKL